MHRIPIALAAAALLATAAVAEPPASADTGCTSYGAGVGVDEVTPVAAILATPEEWAGKTVRVAGTVREVCPMAGCWLSIVAGPEAAPFRVKVVDGEIVFPLSARGLHATAEGTVAVHDMSRDEYAAWLAHLAEEQGGELDPATVGDGPYRRIQLDAVGAAICADPEA